MHFKPVKLYLSALSGSSGFHNISVPERKGPDVSDLWLNWLFRILIMLFGASSPDSKWQHERMIRNRSLLIRLCVPLSGPWNHEYNHELSTARVFTLQFTFKGPNLNYHQRQRVWNNCYYKTCFFINFL